MHWKTLFLQQEILTQMSGYIGEHVKCICHIYVWQLIYIVYILNPHLYELVKCETMGTYISQAIGHMLAVIVYRQLIYLRWWRHNFVIMTNQMTNIHLSMSVRQSSNIQWFLTLTSVYIRNFVVSLLLLLLFPTWSINTCMS